MAYTCESEETRELRERNRKLHYQLNILRRVGVVSHPSLWAFCA